MVYLGAMMNLTTMESPIEEAPRRERVRLITPGTNIYPSRIILVTNKVEKSSFPRQSLNRFTFLVKLGDLIFFLLDLSPIVKLI